MRKLGRLLGVAAVLAVASSSAYADDPRCSAPPYGGTVTGFQAFVKYFGHVVVPTKVLPALCNMKFGGSDRTALYNLGFTDQQIDEKKTEDLAVDMVMALKNLADKTN